MPVFGLEQIAEMLDHARWDATTLNKTCWVNAASENDARCAIEIRTLRMVDLKLRHSTKLASPWADKYFVRCMPDSGKTVPDGHYVTEGRLLELLPSELADVHSLT